MSRERRDLELVTTQVPAAFLSRFLATGARWWLLVVVSPWITTEWSDEYDLAQLLQRVDEQEVATYVITRPPVVGDEAHAAAIARLCAVPSLELRFNPSLHAKVLLAEGPSRALGLLASANLTARGMQGLEAGILMHSRGVGETLIRDLIDFCTCDLRQNSRLVKRRSPRRPIQ